ncbi:DNA-directed RNA polymerase III subunit RPC3 [Skeletonema marinoi]|uniref:DNA-directed RNA polymerase III subunit RPC3 n=1 Tax=Skeletonema marinoi TaxID=267567 RepID=A0AAD8YBB2_9STRA|nr:DNA-directed RNA polymerase III subunit RPC3 [Skeletonema marinoi]
MTNAFGGFTHISPLSNATSSTAHPPDPQKALSSNCIRDYFGPVVQTVTDALQSRGPSTLQDLVSFIRNQCVRDWNEERNRLIEQINASSGKGNGGKVTMNKARGSEASGFVTDASHIRASLIVLLHHGLVHVSGGGSKHASKKEPVDNEGQKPQKPDPTASSTHYTYSFLGDRARLLPRFPRYIQHAKSMIDENAAHLVESLLFNGRMTAEDAISYVWGNLKSEESDDKEQQQVLVAIVNSFRSLIESGYIKAVDPIASNQELLDQQQKADDGINGGEVEFELNDDGEISAGKRKRRSRSTSDVSKSKKVKVNAADNNYGNNKQDDEQVVKLLSPLRKLVPAGSVYRANTSMFHASIRAMVLGRLVSEIYGEEVESNGKSTNGSTNGVNSHLNLAGPIVTAALTYAARQEHAPQQLSETEEEKHIRLAELGIFCPSDIVPFLANETKQSLQTQIGGLAQNLTNNLLRLSKLQYPPIISELEEALGHSKGGKFEINTRNLLARLRHRIIHRVVTTHQGAVAARIINILEYRGHCESDIVAEDAMVPAKEAREALHRLHRENYICLSDMHLTKTHNSGTAIYLWNVIPSRLKKTVINNVSTAILNLRLRRQHEVEVGKDWMDRAKDATDENDNEEDKKKYQAFCKGLERLDSACLQLDETMMVLKDL